MKLKRKPEFFEVIFVFFVRPKEELLTIVMDCTVSPKVPVKAQTSSVSECDSVWR